MYINEFLLTHFRHVLLKPANPVPSKHNCEKLKKTLSRKAIAKNTCFLSRAIFDYAALSERELSFQIGGIQSK
jgi:hypothetical protein